MAMVSIVDRNHAAQRHPANSPATMSRASWRGSLGESAGSYPDERGSGCQTLSQTDQCAGELLKSR